MLKRNFNVKNIETICHVSKINNYVNIDNLQKFKRIPRISFYKENINVLEKSLSILKPVVIHEHIITLKDLINISKYTQAIIVNIDQVYNNLITFKKGRSLFRYIEISCNNEKTGDIYNFLTK